MFVCEKYLFNFKMFTMVITASEKPINFSLNLIYHIIFYHVCLKKCLLNISMFTMDITESEKPIFLEEVSY